MKNVIYATIWVSYVNLCSKCFYLCCSCDVYCVNQCFSCVENFCFMSKYCVSFTPSMVKESLRICDPSYATCAEIGPRECTSHKWVIGQCRSLIQSVEHIVGDRLQENCHFRPCNFGTYYYVAALFVYFLRNKQKQPINSTWNYTTTENEFVDNKSAMKQKTFSKFEAS